MRRRAANAGAATGDHRPLDLELLPQKPPFRFVSDARCARDSSDAAVEGTWRVDGSEAFFAGHFPGDPIVPGVLITEALAQLCGLCRVGEEPGSAALGAGLLVHADIRFRVVVRPPTEIRLRAVLVRTVATLAEFDVTAEEGSRRVAEGRLTLRLSHTPAPREAP